MTEETAATVATWSAGQTETPRYPSRHVRADAAYRRRTLLASDVTDDEISTVGEVLAKGSHHFDSRFNGLKFFIPDFAPTPGNLRMRAGVRRLDRIVYRLIAARRAAPGQGRPRRRRHHTAARADAYRMTDKQIRDEVMTLFLAGHETTALALTWALYLPRGTPRSRPPCARS